MHCGGKTPTRGATRIDALTSDATSLIWKLIKAPTKVEYDEVMTRLLSINGIIRNKVNVSV